MNVDVKIKTELRWKRKNLWISAENDWISMRTQSVNFFMKWINISNLTFLINSYYLFKSIHQFSEIAKKKGANAANDPGEYPWSNMTIMVWQYKILLSIHLHYGIEHDHAMLTIVIIITQSGH